MTCFLTESWDHRCVEFTDNWEMGWNINWLLRNLRKFNWYLKFQYSYLDPLNKKFIYEKINWYNKFQTSYKSSFITETFSMLIYNVNKHERGIGQIFNVIWEMTWFLILIAEIWDPQNSMMKFLLILEKPKLPRHLWFITWTKNWKLIKNLTVN